VRKEGRGEMEEGRKGGIWRCRREKGRRREGGEEGEAIRRGEGERFICPVKHVVERISHQAR